jgi:hypothetical protein
MSARTEGLRFLGDPRLMTAIDMFSPARFFTESSSPERPLAINDILARQSRLSETQNDDRTIAAARMLQL